MFSPCAYGLSPQIQEIEIIVRRKGTGDTVDKTQPTTNTCNLRMNPFHSYWPPWRVGIISRAHSGLLEPPSHHLAGQLEHQLAPQGLDLLSQRLGLVTKIFQALNRGRLGYNSKKPNLIVRVLFRSVDGVTTGNTGWEGGRDAREWRRQGLARLDGGNTGNFERNIDHRLEI